MSRTDTRKWSATIQIAGQELAAEPCPWDTLAEVTKAAISEAAAYLREGLAGEHGEARVHLHKQLAAWPEPRYDRQGAYLWLEGGRVLIQR